LYGKLLFVDAHAGEMTSASQGLPYIFQRREKTMCDYSLFGMPNRLAIEGEQLKIYRFPTSSLGLTSPVELQKLKEQSATRLGGGFWSRLKNWFSLSGGPTPPAVCVPPGARLQLHDIPERLQQQLGVGADEEVTFVQLSAEPYSHRDGMRFNNGKEILLQRLEEGQRVDVLCLSAAVSLTQSEEVRRNTSGPSEFGTNDAPTDLRSFLGEDTDINGEVKFTEIMRVDASISGTITSDSGSLLITEKGRVKATIQAGIVEVSGIVEGTITAKTSVKIHSTGRVYGDIYTPALIIEYGAVFDGKCNTLNGRDQAKSLSKIEQKPLEQKPIEPMPVEPKPFPDPKPLKTADTI
jgi:cytoskeletal protein CcmA (bactofilin family)